MANQPSVAAAIAEIVAQDPELRARVRRLVNGMIAQAEWTLQWGTTADKATLMRAVVPTLMRSLQTAEDDESTRQEREAYARIQVALRS